MAAEKKTNWEKKKVEEIWNYGKKFWAMIRELIGKDREREEETYVYDNDGTRIEIMNVQKDFTESWRENIYQKAEKTDFSFWYEKGGQMEKMIEEERSPYSKVMKLPMIEETELTEVVNNMKNGKASGIDGIKSELMKYIIKDEEIRKYTTKCFNNILKEKVDSDWLTSLTTMVPKVKHTKILEHRPIAVTVNKDLLDNNEIEDIITLRRYVHNL